MSNPTQTSAELFKFEGKPSWGAAFPQAMQHVLAMLIGNITPAHADRQHLWPDAGRKDHADPGGHDHRRPDHTAAAVPGVRLRHEAAQRHGRGLRLHAHPHHHRRAVRHCGHLRLAACGGLCLDLRRHVHRQTPPLLPAHRQRHGGHEHRLSLYKTAISYIGGGTAAQNNGTFGAPQFWFLAILTLIVTLACNFFGKGLLKASGMLIGIVVGYAAALIMGTSSALRTCRRFLVCAAAPVLLRS